MRFHLLIFMLIHFYSCQKTEVKICAHEDWVGTYFGTTTCNNSTGNVTVNVEDAGFSQISITIVSGIQTTFDPFMPRNCAFTMTVDNATGSNVFSFQLEDDEISINEVFANGTCNTVAIKQ